jgi:predicted XRE-type DNA-binding protein
VHEKTLEMTWAPALPGCFELRDEDKDFWYRVIYTRLEGMIYVLHCFKKKTNKTSQGDIRTAKQRLRDVKQRPAKKKKERGNTMPATHTVRASEAKRTISSAVKTSRVGHVTHGDVFDDLAFSPKKTASLKLKSDLHQKIIGRAQGYTQQELQSILSETQSRVSQLMHGKIAGFTLDMLVFYAERLGIHAEIKTKELGAPKHPQLPSGL